MTDLPDFPTARMSADRAMGHARVEFAEMLFQEADDVGPGGAGSTELTAQVQASLMMALYYETRHGNDLLAAHTRALEEHRMAMADFVASAGPPLGIPTQGGGPAQALPIQNGTQAELPPARERVE
jgi:hypothetical protein